MPVETTREPAQNSSSAAAAAAVPADGGARGSARRRTKHHQLTETLRDMVARMDPGDRLPTQDELMRRFRVSDTTVLRSLDDLSRAGVIVRRQGSGTFVADRAGDRAPARSAAPTATGLVAVLSRPIDNPLLSDLLQAVETHLSAAGMAPVLIVDTDRRQRVERARARWEQGGIVGAIHLGTAVLEGIGDLPAVMIGETKADGEFCQVSVDNAAAGRRVAEYLWGLGHRRAAVVTLGNPATPRDAAPPVEGVDHLRAAAFRDHWRALGGVCRDDWRVVIRDLLRLDGGERRSVETMRALLDPVFEGGAPRPTAIFAVHDEMATVAIRALEQMGRAVPGDVSVVGFNDAGSLAAYFRPTLTTVRTPSAILGALGVHLFQDLLRDPAHRPRSVRLSPEIVPRESTGPAPPDTVAVFAETP